MQDVSPEDALAMLSQPQTTTEQVAQVPETAEPQHAQEDHVAQESAKDLNFRLLREAKEAAEREAREAREERERYRQMLERFQPAPPPVPPEPDEFASLAEDDWVTVGQQKKLAAKIAAEIARKAIEEDRRKRYAEEAPQRVYAKCPDYDAVVNETTIRQLNSQDPEMAKALSLIQDEEAKAIAAYKFIKAMLPTSSEDAVAKIKQNQQKPVSSSSPAGKSAVSQAHRYEQGLTPDLKKQLWKEMNEAAKRS